MRVSYAGLKPASSRASAHARASSAKRDTKCELLLRRALWKLGARYRIDAKDLPGRPDIVFRTDKLAIFVDGDFWHGRNLEQRLERLSHGHNAPYWMSKIRSNVERDVRNNRALEARGWHVLRFWETDVAKDPAAVAEQILRARKSAGY